MPVLELFGKCRDLGYCDCGGFLGCVSPALVQCEVCDRSHAPNHPIANIDGDVPIDDEPEEASGPARASVARELPDWLKEKPGSSVIRPASSSSSSNACPQELCQVCGSPWAPKHACLGGQAQELDQPVTDCGYRRRAGKPCVRHGGESATVRRDRERQKTALEKTVASRAEPAPQVQVEEPVAETLPAPVSVAQSEIADRCRNGHPKTPENTYTRSNGRHECKECKRTYQTTYRSASPVEPDRELAAIGTILAALDGLAPDEVKRAMGYVADRIGIKQETQS